MAATRLKGKRFRSVVADSNCLWEVKGSRGRGVFECEVVGDSWEHNGVTYPCDFAGRRDVFTRETIERHLAAAEWSRQSAQAHEGFYASLRHRQVVHYDDGFGGFIRCEVVIADEIHELDHPCVKKGERCLKTLALVGNWRSYDLQPNSYNVRLMGHRFKPNASCIYENPKAPCRERYADPQHLEPIELPEAAA